MQPASWRNFCWNRSRHSGLPVGEQERWYTPRRIIVGIQDIPVRQDDLIETITGPPKSIAYDAAGAPTKAALAFAQKNGVPLHKSRSSKHPKANIFPLSARSAERKPTKFWRRLIPAAIAKIQFPKTMHWSPDQFSICAAAPLDCCSLWRQSRSLSDCGHHLIQLHRRTPVPGQIQNRRFFARFTEGEAARKFSSGGSGGTPRS